MTVKGFLMGSVLVLAAIFVLSKLVIAWHKNREEPDYDERQLAARGHASSAAFLLTAVYFTVVVLLRIFGMEFSLDAYDSIVWLGLLIGMNVYVTICILEDAYVRLTEKAKTNGILFLVVGLFDLVSAYVSLLGGAELGTSLVRNPALLLITGVDFVYAGILLLVCHWRSKRGDADG